MKSFYALILVVTSIILGCSKKPIVAEVATVISSIKVVSGDLQSGTILNRLDNPLVVELTSTYGLPVAKAKVNWNLSECDGSLSSISSVSDSSGLAQIELTLPDIASHCVVTVTAEGVALNASFQANAKWDPSEAEVRVSTSYNNQPGAVGDGVVDDQPAIQRALNYAISMGHARVVFEPNKIYRLDHIQEATGHLVINAYNKTSISLVGNNATLVSDRGNTHQIQGLRNWTGTPQMPIRITDLTFSNTHGITQTETAGLVLNSIDTLYGIQNFRVSRNTFQNFSRQLVIQGTKNVVIRKNKFYMDSGADNGSSDGAGHYGSPNVGLWMFGAGNSGPGLKSYTTDTQIYDNFYDGCRLVADRTKTKNGACGDGFVFGTSLNADIHDNLVTNYSYEGIYVGKMFYPTEIAIAGPRIFHNNLTSGKGLNGWGIRVDQSNSTIEQNEIVDTYGILVAGYQAWDPSTSPGPGGTPRYVPIENVKILDNHITTRTSAQGTYAIQISSASAALVKGNHIQLATSSGDAGFWGIYSVGAIDDEGVLHTEDKMSFEDNTIDIIGAVNPLANSMGFWGQYIDKDTVFKNNVVSNMKTGAYFFFDYPVTDANVLIENAIRQCEFPIRR